MCCIRWKLFYTERTLIEEQSQREENDAPPEDLVKLLEERVGLSALEGIHNGDTHDPYKPAERNRRSTYKDIVVEYGHCSWRQCEGF